MSGGTFDVSYYEIDDAIKTIEDRIKKNGMTLQQIWDNKTEEEKKNAKEWGHDWEIPWTEKNVPDNVRFIAEEEAWKKCKSVKPALAARFKYLSLPTKEAQEDWRKTYNSILKDIIDGHNNGIEHHVYSKATVEEIKRELDVIKAARQYLENIDLLFAGDSGEDSFIANAKKTLNEPVV